MACGGWSSVEDCDALSGERYDRCVDETVVELYKTDVDAADAYVDRVGDALTRDYIYYKVTKEVHPGDHAYCDRIEMDELRTRCKVIVSRPHLHQELSGQRKTGPMDLQGKPGGPGGGPPPPPKPPPGEKPPGHDMPKGPEGG